MNWYKGAENNNFVNKVKTILKKHKFTRALIEYYHIPISDLDNHLKIEICDLDGKFAEGNGKLIRIDRKLLEDNFFKDNFHFVVHEFFHWLKRRSEERFYFNDPEEVQSFVLQMVWEFIQGKTQQEVISLIYPIISAHFENEKKSRDTFKEMFEKANSLYELYRNGEQFKI
jgi:hypothetical protein